MSGSKDKRYLYYMVKLYNQTFPEKQVSKDHQFTNEELFRLKPQHIYAFFANLAYGTPSPSLDDTPTLSSSATFEFAKKAISSFQPNCLLPWNEQSGTGNPTRSALVNNLIKRIKKKRQDSKTFCVKILHSNKCSFL